MVYLLGTLRSLPLLYRNKFGLKRLPFLTIQNETTPSLRRPFIWWGTYETPGLDRHERGNPSSFTWGRDTTLGEEALLPVEV